MKIPLNKIHTTPPNMDFALCVYGEPDQELNEWIKHWNLKKVKSGNFTNLEGEYDFENMFEYDTYFWMDGFSPNLNKHLHIGHLSNLSIASALQSLGVTQKTVAILGDTLAGEVSQSEAFEAYIHTCDQFNYVVELLHYASKMKYPFKLENGTGEYVGTKIFDTGKQKIVGIKTDGSTSYFYQDYTLANMLSKDGKILYLTGTEQNQHFDSLKHFYPDIKHVGLGLVLLDGKKMSSSDGNVIYAKEILDHYTKEFENPKIAVNVLKGQILKSSLDSTKKVNTKDIKNPKTSFGLYLSYTMARLYSAGMMYKLNNDFHSIKLQFAAFKAKATLSPNTLLSELVNTCKEINILYKDLYIKDNKDNQVYYQPLLDDLALGMKKLGMHFVYKV